jgi:bacillithiol synthase
MPATSHSAPNCRMFRTEKLSPQESGAFSRLLLDYMHRDPSTLDLYSYFPDEAGFSTLLDNAPYRSFDRSALCEVLLQQAGSDPSVPPQVLANIEALRKESAYTLTTGHQLCLFTGPTYFIYKILTVIALADRLAKHHPGNQFIPVFWMASEDHDFEEIRSFTAFGKKIEWQHTAGGPVGRMDTAGVIALREEVAALLGGGEEVKDLLQLFDACYAPGKTLAAATRDIVHRLFGRYGVVVIDADDARLKQQFREAMRSDLLEQAPFAEVQQTAEQLRNRNYEVQVNPRPVNFFLLGDNRRERIDYDGGSYSIAGRSVSRNQIEQVISETPELLSPNVVMRPVYQQVILPNIAYAGGPGELAYWLELKGAFGKLGVFFPALVPRFTATIIDKSTASRISKLGLQPAELFHERQEIERGLMARAGNVVSLEDARASISALYAQLVEKALQIDKTLEGNVQAELNKALAGVSGIESRMNRALKARGETVLRQLDGVLAKLLPGGGLQERHENFSTFYLSCGRSFIESVLEKIDPFDHSHLLLIQES